jgi:hypothetical protein
MPCLFTGFGKQGKQRSKVRLCPRRTVGGNALAQLCQLQQDCHETGKKSLALLLRR